MPTPERFRWQWALDVIPKVRDASGGAQCVRCLHSRVSQLMNSMVVNFMKATLHASTKALDGYCALHRLLISFAEEYPDMVLYCDKVIADFVRDEQYRSKKAVPALGEWLPLLSGASLVHTLQTVSTSY